MAVSSGSAPAPRAGCHARRSHSAGSGVRPGGPGRCARRGTCRVGGHRGGPQMEEVGFRRASTLQGVHTAGRGNRCPGQPTWPTPLPAHSRQKPADVGRDPFPGKQLASHSGTRGDLWPGRAASPQVALCPAPAPGWVEPRAGLASPRLTTRPLPPQATCRSRDLPPTCTCPSSAGPTWSSAGSPRPRAARSPCPTSSRRYSAPGPETTAPPVSLCARGVPCAGSVPVPPSRTPRHRGHREEAAGAGCPVNDQTSSRWRPGAIRALALPSPHPPCERGHAPLQALGPLPPQALWAPGLRAGGLGGWGNADLQLPSCEAPGWRPLGGGGPVEGSPAGGRGWDCLSSGH